MGFPLKNATEAVRESVNVILLKKDLNVLEEGVLEGREAFANMLKHIKITASSNFGNICAIVAASVIITASFSDDFHTAAASEPAV